MNFSFSDKGIDGRVFPLSAMSNVREILDDQIAASWRSIP